MASRSDQLHSHQFTLQRAVGALAMRDPDPVSSPLRRIGGALFASVMIAVLAVAAVGVYGVVRPGTGGTWRDGQALIIEKETGARFVFRNGVLYPVLNYTSALLILHTPNAVTVARKELLGVPRGTPMGIPGAPDPLPGADQLVTDPWSLCSRPAPGAANRTESVLRVAGAPASTKLGTTGGLLVVDPNGGLYVLWNNRRFALPQPEAALAALLWNRPSATPVSAALLNALPAGPDIVKVSTPRSTKSSAVPGLKVGEVFVVTDTNGTKLYGVALENGVGALTPLQASLLIVDKANGGDPVRELSQANYAAAAKVTSYLPTGDNAPPAATPTQVQPAAQGGVCATFTPNVAVPELAVAPTVPTAGEVRAQRSATELSLPADYIAVPPGRAVLVESLASAGSPAGSLAVITDLGLRFAVPSPDVLKMLGYEGVVPQRFAGVLVGLVPAGRALDPDAAALPATSGA